MLSLRQWRFNGLVTVVAGLALVVVLALRPPFPLEAVAVPDMVTVAVESGSTGAETDDRGVFWWITAPDATVRVINNEPVPTRVVVSLSLENGPCPVERTVRIGDRVTALGPHRVSSLSTDVLELDGYERLALPLTVDGDACAPTGMDPRAFFVRLGELEVKVADP